MTRNVTTTSFPGWDASSSQSYPPAFHQASLTIHQYPFILLDGERHCWCFAQELNTMTWLGLTLAEVRMAEWLGRWTYNLVVLDSSPPPYHSLDLSSVTPISTTQLCCVNKPTVLSPASWDFQATLCLSELFVSPSFLAQNLNYLVHQ